MSWRGNTQNIASSWLSSSIRSKAAKAVDEEVSRINGCSCPTAHSARTVWPPPRPFDPASFAPVPFDRRLSAEWGLVQEEGRATKVGR